MTPSVRKNAIEKRVDELVGQWNEFAQDPAARMMRWLVTADEARMVDVFLEVQNEEGGDVPDLFIRFEDPFGDPDQYGFTLLESLRDKYEEIRGGIREEGIDSDWVCPAPRPGDSHAFTAALESLATYYGKILEKVVAVLMPAKVEDVTAWSDWLVKLSLAASHQDVRYLVVDSADDPALDTLDERASEVVRSVEADLDMPGALSELARDVPGHGPGFNFRRLFVALSDAAAKGDLETAKRAADSALAIASKQGWPQMQVVIQMALGGALLGAGNSREALTCYRAAGGVANTAKDNGDPVAPKLAMQSKFAEGSALIAAESHAEAAQVYEEAAAIAEDQEDHLMTVEGWRMAAYCHSVAESTDEGWRTGHLALDAAVQLDDDQRENSTLPYVGQCLLQLAGKDEKKIKKVRKRMEELATKDWERKLEATPS